jgi:diketogulonate reductase-like aldo/keto reductase
MVLLIPHCAACEDRRRPRTVPSEHRAGAFGLLSSTAFPGRPTGPVVFAALAVTAGAGDPAALARDWRRRLRPSERIGALPDGGGSADRRRRGVIFLTLAPAQYGMEYVTAQGVDVPAIGFGTWPMKGEACRTAVRTALETGYRHVDTAQMYENEEAVGRAIAESDVPRADVFLVTKVLRGNLARDDLLDSVDESLQRLGTGIDLLLIHAPSRSVPVEESIGAMNELQERGSVDHIGVSNFSVDQLREAIDASDTPILTNQVEYHPFESQDEVLEFCIENDVALTAYSPLAEGRVVGNDVLEEIGSRHGKTSAQVALRWLLQQELVVPIPKASGRTHIEENFDVFDFELGDEEVERIFELQGGLLSRMRSLLGL